jgi:hypothetical protein
MVTGVVEALIKVEVPVALFETHQGDVGECTSPHAFLRLGSAGVPPVLDTRSV